MHASIMRIYKVHTVSAMKGEIIPPTRAQHELNPIPVLRMAVGKTSAEMTYIVANAAVENNFPTKANAVVKYCSSEIKKNILYFELFEM